MNENCDMEQKIKSGSIGIQGKEIYIQNGLSRQDVVDICKGIFFDNFMKLKEEAQLTVNAKIQEFSEKFYEKLEKSELLTTQKFKIPDVQYMLYEAQKAYVRTDDTSMHELIIDLISDRVMTDENCNMQLNINQSIEVISKLNIRHINMLTLIFIIQHTNNSRIRNLRIPKDEDILRQYIEKDIMPFVPNEITKTDIEYLSFCGCGTLLLGSKFQEKFIAEYPNIFQSVREISNQGHKDFEVLINDQFIDFKEYIISLNPAFKKIFDVYNEGELFLFNITSVAKLVAIYNFQRITKAKVNIEKWIRN